MLWFFLLCICILVFCTCSIQYYEAKDKAFTFIGHNDMKYEYPNSSSKEMNECPFPIQSKIFYPHNETNTYYYPFFPVCPINQKTNLNNLCINGTQSIGSNGISLVNQCSCNSNFSGTYCDIKNNSDWCRNSENYQCTSCKVSGTAIMVNLKCTQLTSGEPNGDWNTIYNNFLHNPKANVCLLLNLTYNKGGYFVTLSPNNNTQPQLTTKISISSIRPLWNIENVNDNIRFQSIYREYLQSKWTYLGVYTDSSKKLGQGWPYVLNWGCQEPSSKSSNDATSEFFYPGNYLNTMPELAPGNSNINVWFGFQLIANLSYWTFPSSILDSRVVIDVDSNGNLGVTEQQSEMNSHGDSTCTVSSNNGQWYIINLYDSLTMIEVYDDYKNKMILARGPNNSIIKLDSNDTTIRYNENTWWIKVTPYVNSVAYFNPFDTSQQLMWNGETLVCTQLNNGKGGFYFWEYSLDYTMLYIYTNGDYYSLQISKPLDMPFTSYFSFQHSKFNIGPVSHLSEHTNVYIQEIPVCQNDILLPYVQQS